ncbi:hypothetical protein [Streptomyces sp. CC224B]|uniref:hypothetical protein n=1 Tax=Streptomyces sp. CC224B TaxID=3044571 RepID=UPI0024A9A08A|nr:hypothetical protein [Streptomyces sp. CC224B]
MSAYQRLMAEALPTGTFGHAELPCPRRTGRAPSWSAEEQAAHVAELEAELDRLEGRGTGKLRLQVIDGQAA